MSDFERQVIEQVRDAISAAIVSQMQGYSSPLRKHVEAAMDQHAGVISALIAQAVTDLAKDDFGEEIRGQLRHQLARTIVAKAGGEYEKRLNELRSHPETRAKITTAIAKALESLS